MHLGFELDFKFGLVWLEGMAIIGNGDFNGKYVRIWIINGKWVLNLFCESRTYYIRY